MAARRSADREHRDFLVEVAWLHHEHGLTQDAIARRYGISRSTVSRALAEAEARGIVQVTVTEPVPAEWLLAEELSAAYGIAAHVGAPLDGADGVVAAGRIAARLVERAAAAGHVTIAASWGRTLAAAAGQVRRRATRGVVVADAVGFASGGQIAPALEVTRTLAAALGASATHLASPAFADSPESLRFLITSPPVEQGLLLARGADLVLVSIGVVGEDSLLVEEGFVGGATMAAIADRGAVGEILGWYYDAAGQAIEPQPLLPVGLTLDDLRAACRVVAVAAGERKADAIRGAVAGGIVDELVVDDALARALLRAATSATLDARHVTMGGHG
jgi:DNA-binding transcriptional regulator LsrR (DeoR family)